MVVALAVAAANALVQAMVTDGWEGVRQKFASLFGRGRPDSGIERRLDSAKQELEGASAGELENVKSALTAQWTTRFGDLLADHPDLEPQLAAMVRELQVTGPVVASGQGVAAGRDVKVSARDGSVAATVIAGNVTLPAARPPDPTKPGPASS